MADNNKGCKITLYWLEQSRSHRILWLLEELQLKYELKTFKRRADKLAPAELKKVHQLGKSPVITIETPGADRPLVLAESAAIVEYLCDHFGSARPTLVPERYQAGREGQVGGEREEWMRYRYFMHYAEGTLMPFLVMALVNDSKSYSWLDARSHLRLVLMRRSEMLSEYADVELKAMRTSPPFFIRPITSMVASQVEAAFLSRNIESNLAFLEQQLHTAPEGGPYLCGKELTAADILMSFPIIAASGRILKDKKQQDKYPLLAAYAKRLEGADGYKQAVAKIEKIEGHFSASM